jgi:KaiC/GvpD/RAD55 family RecA-like ATPase
MVATPHRNGVGIPVEVPGLNTIIPEFEDGRLLVVESGPDPAKSFFVRQLTLTALRDRRPVTFVTTRDRGELETLLTSEAGNRTWSENEVRLVESEAPDHLERLASPDGLLAVDSFSFLTLDSSGSEVAQLLRALRVACHEQRTTVVLATDRGMVEPRSEAVLAHLADGVLEFRSREAPEGLQRFLRVAKWTNGKIVDRNIHYEFDGKRISVDLRSRVL